MRTRRRTAPADGAGRVLIRRRQTRARAWLGLTVLAAVSCVEPGARRDPAGEEVEIAELTIDAGATLALDPGRGIGVAVQYAGEGAWSLTSTCDTSVSGASCLFDVVATTLEDATIWSFDGRGLEADDVLWQPDPYSVQLELLTEADEDVAIFSTAPGVAVRVSVLLYDPVFDSPFDWSDDPRILSWVGGGAVHQGAPTNPVDLRPDRP